MNSDNHLQPRSGLPGNNRRYSLLRSIGLLLLSVGLLWSASPAETKGATATFELDTGSIEGTISPLLFGHNLEHTRRAVWQGISSQMIANRKFAGESYADSRANYTSNGFIGNMRTQNRPDPNGVAANWYGIGKAGTSFYMDREIVFAGNSSQRIDVFQEDYPGGVGQGSIDIKTGEEYEIRVWLRTHFKMDGDLRICDRTGRKIYFEESKTWSGNQWHLWAVTWTPSESDETAKLEITFDGLGSAWLGAVSMMPTDNFKGMRPDVIELLKEMSVPWLRWPGGNFTRNFKWKNGLLPVDRRTPTAHGHHEVLPFTDNYDFNEIGVDEFMALCEKIDAEPSLVLNITDSAESAADLLEYCNGSVETEWGKLRVERGHPEPFGVKIWSIGNENWGQWMGPAYFPADEYSGQVVRFVDAMRKVDPSITTVASGMIEANGWSRGVIAGAGSHTDLISVHHYGPSNGPDINREVLDQAKFPSIKLRDMLTVCRRDIDSVSPAGKQTPISLDEWNKWHWWFVRPFEEEWHAGPVDGMYIASALNMLCRESLRMNIHSAALFQPINEGCIAVKPHSARLTAAGQAYKLFRAHHGGRLLTPSPPGGDDIDLLASVSEDGRRLFVTLLNRNSEEERAVEIKLAGNEKVKSAQARLLTAADLKDPDAVFVEGNGRVKKSGGTVSVSLPKYAIALLEINL
ncbi:hypothetical protein ACFLT7_06575 [candidate division KSB1 bacterium]